MRTSLIQLVVIILFSGVSPLPASVHRTRPTGVKRSLPAQAGSVLRRPTMGVRLSMHPALVAAYFPGQGTVKPQPLSQKQVLELMTGGVPNQRIVELVKERGIDFQVDEDFVRALRKAGADNRLVAALRDASVTMADVLVETSPNAQVFLDGNPQGQADTQGVLTARAKPGSHLLKVSLAGKRDFEQTVTFAEGEPNRVQAPLADLAGALRVKTLAGAAIWLDNSTRGTVDSTGELLLGDIPPGVHVLRVTASGKVDSSQSVNVADRTETPVAVTLADAVRTNPQDGLKYVWIAAGTFTMGCSQGDNDCAEPEKPAHKVVLSKDYWIGQTEVTVAAYKRFVDTGKAKWPPTAPKLYRSWKEAQLPIVDVTWNEANQFCVWAGGRLPTEAEWEYAARGGSTQARYGELSEIAWFKDNAASHTHEVATKLANLYGLFDTLGNVWEWVNDWYDPNYYQQAQAQDPSGPTSGQEKVLRGGAWIVDSKLLRVSDRYSIKPDARSDFFGFRCVLVGSQ